MTRRAEELGMKNATFANSTGWPHPDHRMSAHDLAEMARITIRDHPELYEIYAEQEFDYCVDSPANRFNRNPVLGVIDGADGLKTGHTEESGYGLVASAVRDGKRRIVVFNGLDSNAARSREAERLLNAAFRDFEVGNPYAAGDVVAQAPVALGETDAVDLVIQEPITLGYHRRAARDVEAWVDYEGPLKAPVAEGDKIGTFHLAIPGSPEITRDVFAGASVAKKGLIGRAQDGLVHYIRTGSADAG
jgi:D-alanyl-D-alanine carboxypeptidase (penicillin-binding protein 5/6)